MKRRQKAVTVTPEYMAAWTRLFTRSPEELEAERASRQPAPAPHCRDAHKGHIQAAERTQGGTAGQPYRRGVIVCCRVLLQEREHE